MRPLFLKSALALVAVLATIAGFSPAQAQNDDLADRIAKSLDTTFVPLPNGFSEDIACPIRKTDWKQRFPHNPITLVREGNVNHPATPSRMILSWYYSGPEAMLEAHWWEMKTFADCFDRTHNCGLQKDNKLAATLRKANNKWSKGDEKRMRKAFSTPPPAAAIAFASRGLGRCFGDNPAQPGMEEMGFTKVNGDRATCQQITNFIQPGFETWHAYYRVDSRCESGLWMPTALIDTVNRAQADAEAKAYAFANRPVEERIAGLTGCQIAYSLVFRGINGQSNGKVPDEAISWALKYEQANLWGDICPVMPVELSNWVQAQPLERFEPVEDPFDSLVRNGPWSRDYGGWRAYLGPVMARYETPGDPQIQVPADICPDFRAWLSQSFTNNYNDPRPERRVLIRNLPSAKGSASGAFCEFVPRSMFYTYQQERKLEATKLAEAQRRYAIRERERQAFQDKLNAAKADRRTSYLWNNKPAEQRCYRTGETQLMCFGG